MKVALLTFHNALNYGAALQVFASQQAITKLGHECDIIDYVNIHRKEAYSMGHHFKNAVKNKHFKSALKYGVGSTFMNLRRKKFLDFYSNNLTYTEKSYNEKSKLKELNNQYNKFIVGSDQVWNFSNNGNDTSYFLDFVSDNTKKIAYSSSFGIAEIPGDLKNSYRSNLMKIKHLSTRENYGVKLIKDLTEREAELVLDPVFLLDKEEWNKLFEKTSKKSKYVFAYTNKAGQFEDFLKQTKYPLNGKKVHKLSRHITPTDFLQPSTKVAYTISPKEFYNTIANAELVITASFHCIAMSIILNVPFVAILTGDKGKDERVMNILELTNLKNRILDKDMNLNEVMTPIDFDRVNEKIKQYKSKSLSYLQNSIMN